MVVQSLLLGVHLVAVNLAAAGPLLCPMLQWQSARGGAAGEALARVGRRLALWSLVAFLVGSGTGILQGYWWWTAAPERSQAALARLAAKVHFGLWELGFYVACMLIYLLWWQWSPPRSVLARSAHAIWALAAATNLLWHFPPLMTIFVYVAAHAPEGEHIGAGEFRALLLSPEILPRCMHVWLASLAVGGIALAWLAAQAAKGAPEAAGKLERWAATGGRIALVTTLLQAFVGAWVLLASPAVEQTRLMGGDLATTLLLVASIAAALWLLHLLGTIAVGPATLRQISTAALVMALIIFLMSATLIAARGDALRLPIAPYETEMGGRGSCRAKDAVACQRGSAGASPFQRHIQETHAPRSPGAHSSPKRIWQ